MAGDERVERPAETERRRVAGNVVNDAVGDGDDPRDALARQVADGGGESSEKTRAVVLAAILDLDDAQIHAIDRGEALLHLGARRIRLPRPLGDRLRAGAIDDEHGRVAQLLAVLDDETRIGERHEQGREAERPPDRAAPPRHDEGNRQGDGEGHARDERPPGDEGLECELGHHCPSRSSSAGACT